MAKGLLDIQSLYPELSRSAEEEEEQRRIMEQAGMLSANPWATLIARSGVIGSKYMRQGLAQAFNNRGLLSNAENWDLEMKRLDPSKPEEANALLSNAVKKYRPELMPALMAAEERRRAEEEKSARADRQEARQVAAFDAEIEQRAYDRSRELAQQDQQTSTARTILGGLQMSGNRQENLKKFGLYATATEAMQNPVVFAAAHEEHLKRVQTLGAIEANRISAEANQMRVDAERVEQETVNDFASNGYLDDALARHPGSSVLKALVNGVIHGNVQDYARFISELGALDRAKEAEERLTLKELEGLGAGIDLKEADFDSAIPAVMAEMYENGLGGKLFRKAYKKEDKISNDDQKAAMAQTVSDIRFAIVLLSRYGVRPDSPQARELLAQYAARPGDADAMSNLKTGAASLGGFSTTVAPLAGTPTSPDNGTISFEDLENAPQAVSRSSRSGG